jgi:predicted GNAT family acetyltransferase
VMDNEKCEGIPLYYMTQTPLRDLFAGMALQGIISTSKTGIISHWDGQGDAERLSKIAFEYADAMLKERKK